jgi:uncharacterized protein YcbK (DUF882 family)
MSMLSKNISRGEVECHCGCGFDTMDSETIDLVQGACDYFAKKQGVPRVVLTITSGARCEKHNKEVGGSPNSQHTKGRAMDIKILGVPPEEVYYYFTNVYQGQYGIGKYDSFTHIDSRTNGPARW